MTRPPEGAASPGGHAMRMLVLLALALPALANQEPKKEPPRRKVEVAFVLETTGSMSGLIQAAKQKIWAIANEIARARPTPDLRIGLVAYRDRGDEYVTKVHDLDLDLDKVYQDLCGYKADGGGDGPESVNEAIRVAVTKLSWSAGKRAACCIANPRTTRRQNICECHYIWWHLDQKRGYNWSSAVRFIRCCRNPVAQMLLVSSDACPMLTNMLI